MVAVFSAGADATGTYTVNVSGTQTADFISVEEGNLTFSGGTLVLTNAGGTINVGAGATALAALAILLWRTSNPVDTPRFAPASKFRS